MTSSFVANSESGPRESLRKIGLPLCGLLFVAAMVRIVAWSNTAVMFNDGPVFLAIADAIDGGQWAHVLAHPYHPLYSFGIHLAKGLGFRPEEAAIAVSIFGALIGIAALHHFLRRVFDLEIAWMGAWTLALHPWAVDFSSDVMSDGLYLGFYLLAFAALMDLIEAPSAKAAVAGASFSVLAFLVRPEGLGLLLVAGLIIVWRMGKEASYRRLALGPLAGCVLVAVVGLAPYVGTLSLAAGELTWTQKKSVAALVDGKPLPDRIASLPERPKTEDLPIWLPESAGSAGVGQPSRDLSGALEAVVRVVRTSASALRYEVLAFVLIGAGMMRRRPLASPWPARTLALSILMYSGVLVLLVWGAGYLSRRHALAPLIPLLGYAAVAWRGLVTDLVTRWTESSGRPSVLPVVRSRIACGALVAVLLVGWGPRDLRERRPERVALRDAAHWIQSTRADAGPVAAEKLRIAYYAGRPYVPLRADPGRTLEASLRERGARWIIIDEDRIGEFPSLQLADGKWAESRHHEQIGLRRAVVLEIVETPAR